MRLVVLLLVLLPIANSRRLLGQEINPKVIATLVTQRKITFSPKSRITIWLDENQSYSISPVVADNTTHTYRSASEASALLAGPGGGMPPRPPPPRPPSPINHTGPRPPMPVPPGPHNSRPPKPPPKPKPPARPKTKFAGEGARVGGPETTSQGAADLLHRLAEQGVVVGRLETGGISQHNWKLARGAYTIALTILDGKPVATLINSGGEFVITFDNVFFVAAE